MFAHYHCQGLSKPQLLDYVRRNLAITLYYVHPNGKVVSEASGRQGKAGVGTMEGYFYPYRYMALRDNNGDFAAMCRLIEKTILAKSVYYLDYFLEDSTLWAELPPSQTVPTNYAKEYSKVEAGQDSARPLGRYDSIRESRLAHVP